MKTIQLNSKFCLNANQCYDVKTDLPIWLLIILAGSSYLILKELSEILSK